MARSDFSAKYFTPAFKPRFKPRVGGRITPFGISKPEFKPRVLPTPVKSITSGTGTVIKPPHIAVKPSISSLKIAAPKGTTKPKQPAQPKPPPKNPNRIATNPQPAGYKPPQSMAAQRPGTSTGMPRIPRVRRPKLIKIGG